MVKFSSSTDRFSFRFSLSTILSKAFEFCEIWPDLDEIRLNLDEISPDIYEIRPNLNILDKNTSKPLLSVENNNFSMCRQSSQLKIGFSSSNLPIDPPFSGSRNGDPLPTVIDIGSVDSQVGLNGLGGWVGSRVCLDTLTHIHEMTLERFIWYIY